MKRKLKETEDSEEINEDENETKKVKNDSEDEENDEDETMETSSNFDIKKFRQNLKAGNFYDDLKLFIKKAAKSTEIIEAFTAAGGKPQEIVEVIKNNEESSLEVVSNLYHMLRMIIFNSVNDETANIDPTIQALKFLVNRNKISIEKMLASSKTSDKVVMLKILSIATSLDRNVAGDILKKIDIFAKSTEKDDFSILEDNKKKKVAYEDSVRLAFVHFILGFLLNDKDPVLCKRILQKRSLFEFFLRDLHLDNFETVKTVVTCLTKNVLISSNFSKPEKLKIFTDNAIKSMLKLYEWKGSEEEKTSVLNIAHQFLLLLLTSKKHGIVFKALSDHRQNQRQLQVLNLFKHVWNLEYPSMLVIEIIKSCPDLMQNLLNRLVMGLQPKITTQWFMCANFSVQLISVLDPAAMFKTFSMLEAKKISSNIIKLSISQFILQNVNERALIQQESLEVRETSAHLLHLMLDRCCKYLEEVARNSTLKDFEKHRIKFDIINHIFTFYPNIDIILNSLYRSINLSAKKESENNEKLVKSQLKHTLEILLLVIKNFPTIIEKIPSVIDYLEVLRPIYEYQLSGADEDVNQNEDLEIEMKVVKIILFLQPSILALESEMFQRIFIVLIQVYCCSLSGEYRKESKMLLKRILQNTSIFSADDSLEIGVWLETFRAVKRGILKESAATFVKALRAIKSDEGESLKWKNQESVEVDSNLLAMIDSAGDETLEVSPMELSQVLPSLLKMKSNKINRIVDFVEIAVVMILHCYPQQRKALLELLTSDEVELNTRITGYFKKKSLTDFGEFLEFYGDLVYRKFQLSVMKGEKFTDEVEDIQQLELLIIQAVFCAVSLEKSGKFSAEKLQILTENIENFYKKIVKSEGDDLNFSASKILPQDSTDTTVNKIFDLTMDRPSKSTMNYIFQQQSLLVNEFSVGQPNQLTKFMTKLIDTFKASEDFEVSTSGLRSRVITELNDVLTSGGGSDEICEIVEKFPLDDSNCIAIIGILVKQKGNLKEFHVKLLSMMLGRLTELKTSSLSTKLMQKVEKLYVEASENAVDMSEFETVFVEYLTIFPHNIGDLSEKTFQLTLRNDQVASKSFVRLINFIFTRSNVFNNAFKSEVAKLKKEVMFPLLSIAIDKGIITANQLKPIYQDCKSGMLKTIEKPNKAAQIYRENIHSSMKLIAEAMPLNECQDLSLKKFKFDASEIYQLRMLQAIFTKALKANPDVKIFMNFVNHWLHLFSLTVAKASTVNEDYLTVIEEWLKLKPPVKDGEEPTEVNSKALEAFYRICLKNGLKSSEGSAMLILLGKLLRSVDVNPDDIATIFDMIFTHSNFFNVVFNYRSSGKILKRNLFYLLNILVQKNPAVAHEKHVPIFLSAYHATMSSCDQMILNLLRFYELRCEIDFFDFRPFLFGPTAMSHFTSNDDQEIKLIKKSVDDINVVYFKLLGSFERALVENTVNNYPLKRELAGVAAEDLDKLLIDDAQLQHVYDPGYFLPLFEMIVESGTFNFGSAAIKYNLLSLIFPAFSCEDENMRLLAAHILMKHRSGMENKKGAKDIWLRFFDSMQMGLGDITEDTKGEKEVKKFPRAASISTQLLAQMVNVLPNRLNNLHGIVVNYLSVREKFDFTTIPELLVLFHSTDVQQEEHRLFLLNVIHHGIKDDLDFKLLNNTPLLRMLLSCYGCPLSDRKIDLMVLKIIDKIVTKTSKIDFMVQRYGLVLWIYQAAVKVEAFEYDAIEMILTLIENSFNAIQRETEKDVVSGKRLLAALLTLLPKFTKAKLSGAGFVSFLKTINGISQSSHISQENRELILDLIKIFMPENLLRSVTYFIDHPEAARFTNQTDPTLAIDETTRTILDNSRRFLMNYHKK